MLSHCVGHEPLPSSHLVSQILHSVMQYTFHMLALFLHMKRDSSRPF